MLSSKEKWFVFFAILSVFSICGEYAVTRPTSNALFLTLFSFEGYPWVWLATVPLNFSAVYLYNRFLPRIGPLKLVWIFALLTSGINGFAGWIYSRAPEFIFFQYAWKDIYILLMLKQIWSLIHGTIAPFRAKYLYGCIYGMGTIGAICGSLIPGFLATFLGSEKILYLTFPIYFLLLFSYTMAYRRSGVNPETFEKGTGLNPKPQEAFSLIRRSPVLVAILLLVIFMQISVALMEYQFNAHLEIYIPEKDLRTAYCGKLSGLINLASLILQFIGGFLLVRMIGLYKSHFLVPILLCSSAISSLAFPSFALLSFSYVFLKALDFSLFGVIREMLYVPLQLDAKFRAKAIIDVFAYRTSKAIVSLTLLLLQIIGGSYLLQISGYLSIGVFGAWLIAIAFLFRKQEKMGAAVE